MVWVCKWEGEEMRLEMQESTEAKVVGGWAQWMGSRACNMSS